MLDSFTREYVSNFTGTSDNVFIPRDYILTADKIRTASSISDKRLTKEEKLQRAEDFIKTNNIEVDTTGIFAYFYKAVNLDYTNMYSSDNKITYEIGKIFTEKCDENIRNSCSFGLHATSYKEAIAFGKNSIPQNIASIIGNASNHFPMSSVPQWSFMTNNNNSIINPSILTEESKFRLLKVKIAKDRIIVPTGAEKIRTNQMEIIEEIELKVTFKYSINSITESDKGYTFDINVKNELTGRSLDVKFIADNIDITQDEIKTKIKERINILQKIYDKKQETNGEIEL